MIELSGTQLVSATKGALATRCNCGKATAAAASLLPRCHICISSQLLSGHVDGPCHKDNLLPSLVLLLSSAELRKERSERAIGGVTPGEDAYYAAATRVVQANPPAPAYSGNSDYSSQDVLQLQRPPIQQQQQSQQQASRPQLAPSSSRGRQPGMPGALSGGAEAGIMQEWSSPEIVDEEELEQEHGELMESILEDEEEIIALHRQQIEDAMEIVRREMAMLQEVDQPGSSIDQYVDSLEAVLASKMDGIRKLQSRLDRFKGKLRQEDLMSRTVQKKQSSIGRSY
eukprot:GHUV01035097.1.p1 GENE.GHUV01035097.1~~GHUV01035097.1.p1  ORF type:complete len:285 (+),score=97.95 GHUV01035097.1:78-932(+)